ncbi:MAG: cytochrome c [Burkholderiaceae bacterium]
MMQGFSVRSDSFVRVAASAAIGLCLAVLGTQVNAESDTAYCERQQGPARVVCMRQLQQEAQKQPAAPTAAGGAESAAAESDRAYCERQQGPARVACTRQLNKPAAPTTALPTTATGNAAAPTGSSAGSASQPATSSAALYHVEGGFHVDPQTMKGFRTWRAAACDRCHGANQEGLVGPSLIESLKTLSKAAFVETVTKGRLQRGMPSFGNDNNLTSNIDHLYAYLKGRSDGAITKSKVEPIN